MPGQSEGERFAIVWLIALVLTILTIVAHIYSPSTWSLSDTQWEQTLSLHRDSTIFRVRPLTTSVVTFLHDAIGIQIKWGFFSLQFLLYFLCGPAFYYYLRHLQVEYRFALAGMVVWLLSLPLFLAHFEPVFTWSDFWVYLFVPLSLAASTRGSMTRSILFMIIALLARETTLLFVPFLVWLFYRNGTPDTRRGFAVAAVSVALFLALRIALAVTDSPSPDFKLWFNFAGWERARDSLFSLFVSLGVVWLVGLVSASRNVRSGERIRRVLGWGGLVVSAGLVSSGLLFGQARESRLFAPAAIFLIPLMLDYLKSNAVSIGTLIRRVMPSAWIRAVAAIVAVVALTFVGKLIIPHFEYRRWQDANWLYLGFHLTATIAFPGYLWFKKKLDSVV